MGQRFHQLVARLRDELLHPLGDRLVVQGGLDPVGGVMLVRLGTAVPAGLDVHLIVDNYAPVLDELRSELEELRATGQSVMPEGLEKDVTQQEFADIIAYLRSLSDSPEPLPEGG